MRKSPHKLYIEGNWYIILSCWINLINENSRQLFESVGLEEAHKRGYKKIAITRKKKESEIKEIKKDYNIKPLSYQDRIKLKR